MQEQTVVVGIQDLINLMSSEVARKVVDELREKEINPLHVKIAQLEIRLATPQAEVVRQTNFIEHLKGVGDGAWKFGVIAMAILEAWHYLK